ncbi:hypothetical protein RSAG8_09110, partial [Rhizoctonia solani AG-8 WAC10335]
MSHAPDYCSGGHAGPIKLGSSNSISDLYHGNRGLVRLDALAAPLLTPRGMNSERSNRSRYRWIVTKAKHVILLRL